MACLLDSALYKERMSSIAVALDEGLASTTDVYSVFYGERLPWWVSVKATGNTGHASRFIESTAVEQILDISKRALEFRRGQRAALHGDFRTADHSNCSHAVAAKQRRLAKDQENKPMTMGDVTSLNITTIEAGVRVADTYAYNCVPPIAKCSFDIRISPHVEPQEMKDLLDTWCRECSADAPSGHNLEWCLMDGQTGSEMQKHALTSIDTKINPWYGVFTHAMSNMGKNISPEVFPAATDSRFLRALGIRALGFSPMRNTQVMLHENDEYLEEDIFVEGIGVYVGLIQALASQGKQPDE
jgi:aminoacylase